MNIKTGVKFHNRFDIEVRDKDTGKLKQSGEAENIILDREYTRVCNFNSYFTHIHFGSGTGTLDPSRTTLFSSLGNKLVVDEEKIKAYPVSKITKRIRLEPEEYIGSIITEVGVSETTSAINTHALIKDAEGNPLSIEKTELDVVIIYASVFIELSDANDITFNKFTTNMLINYFVDGTQMNPSLWLGDIGEPTEMGTIGFKIGEFPLTRSADAANKKTSFSTRLGVDNANYDIRELTLGDICRVHTENNVKWNPLSLTDISIGVGDGETAVFDINRHDITNVVIKVDGNATNDYTLENVPGDNRERLPLWKIVSPTATDTDSEIHRGCYCNVPQVAPINDITIEVDPSLIVGTTLEFVPKGGRFSSASLEFSYIYLDGSYDGESFTQLHVASQYSDRDVEGRQFEIAEPYTHLRIRFGIYHHTSASSGYSGQALLVGVVKPDYTPPQIVFNTPPPEGSIITADYTVPYIPKTSDYVLDVDFTLQFGEGL